MSRRSFVGAMGAMGGMGALGVMQVVRVADASEAAEAEADAAAAEIPTEIDMTPTKPFLHTTEEAQLPCGHVDPLKLVSDLSAEEVDAALLDMPLVTEDYVTPGGKTIPALYVNVRNRFNRLGIGIGSAIDDNEDAWETIFDNFPEDEAEEYLKLPLFVWFTAQDYAAEQGYTIEEAAERLDKMASHSLITFRIRAGVKHYAVMAPLWGVWEMNMDIFDADYCNTFNASLGSDFAFAAVNCARPLCQIVPATTDVVEGDVLPYTSWKETVEQNELFALSPCQCRLEKDVTAEGGDSGCTHSRETCISVGETAQFFIDRGIGRQITQEEAIQRIQDSVDEGLMIEMLFSKHAEVICQCCGDCCKLCSTYKALGGIGNMMENISAYTLKYDADTCIGCGACVSQCQMEAITLGEDGKCTMDAKCLRCGQCATVCPVEARHLVARPAEELIELPEDMIDDYHQFSRLRMAQGYIQDFTGAAQ